MSAVSEQKKPHEPQYKSVRDPNSGLTRLVEISAAEQGGRAFKKLIHSAHSVVTHVLLIIFIGITRGGVRGVRPDQGKGAIPPPSAYVLQADKERGPPKHKHGQPRLGLFNF